MPRLMVTTTFILLLGGLAEPTLAQPVQQLLWTPELRALEQAVLKKPGTGEVTWLPLSLLDSFLSLQPEEVSLLGISASEQKAYQGRIQRLMDQLEPSEEPGALHGMACEEPFSRHAQTTYLTPDEAASREPLASIEDLISRADNAFLVRVELSEVGFAWGELSRKVHATIQVDLARRVVELEGVEIHFIRDVYDVHFRGQRLCQHRPGYFEAEAGDTILILGRFIPERKRFLVANLFRVEDGVVLPQPYSFLRQENFVLGLGR